MFNHMDRKIYVYFVMNTVTGHIKIGQTKQPQERLKQLQSGCDDPLLLLAVVEDRLPLEQVLHLQFQDTCTGGEWFEQSPGLMTLINNINLQTVYEAEYISADGATLSANGRRQIVKERFESETPPTITELAEELGVSRGTIYNDLAVIGINL
jgi:hypothetical protein